MDDRFHLSRRSSLLYPDSDADPAQLLTKIPASRHAARVGPLGARCQPFSPIFLEARRRARSGLVVEAVLEAAAGADIVRRKTETAGIRRVAEVEPGGRTQIRISGTIKTAVAAARAVVSHEDDGHAFSNTRVQRRRQVPPGKCG